MHFASGPHRCHSVPHSEPHRPDGGQGQRLGRPCRRPQRPQPERGEQVPGLDPEGERELRALLRQNQRGRVGAGHPRTAGLRPRLRGQG